MNRHELNHYSMFFLVRMLNGAWVDIRAWSFGRVGDILRFTSSAWAEDRSYSYDAPAAVLPVEPVAKVDQRFGRKPVSLRPIDIPNPDEFRRQHPDPLIEVEEKELTEEEWAVARAAIEVDPNPDFEPDYVKYEPIIEDAVLSDDLQWWGVRLHEGDMLAFYSSHWITKDGEIVFLANRLDADEPIDIGYIGAQYVAEVTGPWPTSAEARGVEAEPTDDLW